MSAEEKENLNNIVQTLHAVKENKSQKYTHKDTIAMTNGKRIEHTYEVDREQHLESMIEWAIDQIEQNFDYV
ncbi:type II toxin-antitoxin system antitoxin, TscA family [Mammaliicoccus sciuri]|uniref:TscA family type II toxin-antitoxin system antitoxin n=1 Tax=Mammaliicoccus sciuri TaxID=1296 RepID=UPI0034DDB9EE